MKQELYHVYILLDNRDGLTSIQTASCECAAGYVDLLFQCVCVYTYVHYLFMGVPAHVYV